ncbi:MAG: hypothetical protein R3D90_13015 [Paracoccaceae bacterium]
MSRILARSVTADLCGRLFNLLLFILLLPFVLLLATLPQRAPVRPAPIGQAGQAAPPGRGRKAT